jgi:hypothetical protein
MSEIAYLKNYRQILDVVTNFNKVASNGPFEVDDESITEQDNNKPSGKDYVEVVITRGDILLHTNGFIKHGGEEYETVGIRVAKIVGGKFKSVFPSTDMKSKAAEGTEEKLREALLIADKI